MYELAKDDEIQTRLLDEVKDTLAKHKGHLTMEALNEMKYLDAILCETLRMRPVGLTLRKICTKPYTLPKLPKQDKAYVIPAKSSVIISILGLHMDAQFYPAPEKFNPERFMENERHGRHKAVFIPFGEGPRMCPGMKFGMIQTKAALVNVIEKFRIRLSPNCKDVEIDPNAFMFIPVHPLLLNFEVRK